MATILGANTLSSGYDVANSCRFDDGSSTQMNKTISSTSTTWTFSCWIKLNPTGTNQYLASWDMGSGESLGIGIEASTNQLFIYTSSTSAAPKLYDGKLRDPSAWYNIVIKNSSGTITSYINGTQAKTSITGTALASGTLRIGCWTGSNYFFDGYMAEVVLIDGTAYSADSFGEFDSDSPTIWKPKDVSGLTFGTNGFYLDFEDSSNLGNDANGGTDLTETNLAATDQTTDTPTNSFCTFNPLYNFNVDPTYSEGNCLLTFGGTWGGGKATMAVDKGKWYWEAKLSGTMANHFHGIQEVNVSGNLTASNPMNLDGSVMFFNQDGGEMRKDDTDTTNDYGTFSDGDIIGIALNMDGGSYGQITIYKNGSAIVSDYDLSSNNDLVAPFTAGGGTMSYNFGGSPSFTISSGNADANGYGNFEYAVPSGYYALCTKNLAEFG